MKFVLDIVSNRWEQGDPISFHEIYIKTSKKFNDDAEMELFKRTHLTPNKRGNFSTWLARVLKRKGWVLRKKLFHKRYQQTGFKLLK